MAPLVLLRYLLFPLRAVPLVLIALFSIVLAVATHAGVFGIPALAIVGSWFFKYAFAMLDDIVDGRDEPPVLSYEIINSLQQRPLGMFLLVCAFHSATAALAPWLGATLIGILRLTALAVLPAMIAAMAVTGRFVDALNPVAVIYTIARIPVAYVALLLTIVALWLFPVLMLRSAGDSLAALWRIELFLPAYTLNEIGLRGAWQVWLAQVLFMYLWLTTFACIGGTLYEHRRQLAIDVAHSPERRAERASAELERHRDRIWDRIFAELRGGASANARESVRKLIASSAEPLEDCRWLYARANAVDTRLANYIAQLTLPRFLATRATGEALNMARERLAATRDFRPQSGEQALQLAELARAAGDRKTARLLIADFDRHYANDPMAPVAARLAAELER